MVKILLHLLLCIMTLFSAQAMNSKKTETKEKQAFLADNDTENLQTIAATILKFYQENKLSNTQKDSTTEKAFEHLFNAGLYYASLAQNNNDFISKQLLSAMLCEQAKKLQKAEKKSVLSQAYNLQASPSEIFFVTFNSVPNNHKEIFGEKCTKRLNPLDNQCMIEHKNEIEKKYEKTLEEAENHYLYDIIFENKSQTININDTIKKENKRIERHKKFLKKENVLYQKLKEEADKGVYESLYLVTLFDLCGKNKKEEKSSLIPKITMCAQNPKAKTAKRFKFTYLLESIPEPTNKKDFKTVCTLFFEYLNDSPEQRLRTICYATKFLKEYGDASLFTTDFFTQCISLAEKSWSIRTEIINLLENSCTNNCKKVQTIFGKNCIPLANLLKPTYKGNNILINFLILFADAQAAINQEELVLCIDTIIDIFNRCSFHEKISFYNQIRSLIKILKTGNKNISFLNDISENYAQYNFYARTDFKGPNYDSKKELLKKLLPELIKLDTDFAQNHSARITECISFMKNNLQDPEILYLYAHLHKYGIPEIFPTSEQNYILYLQKAATLGDLQAQLELAHMQQEPIKALQLYVNILSRTKNITEEMKNIQKKAEEKINEYLKSTFDENRKQYLKIRTFLINHFIKQQKINAVLVACKELFQIASSSEDSQEIAHLKKLLLSSLARCIEAIHDNNKLFLNATRLMLESILLCISSLNSNELEKYIELLESKNIHKNPELYKNINELLKKMYEKKGKELLEENKPEQALLFFKKTNDKKFELIANALFSLSCNLNNFDTTATKKYVRALEELLKNKKLTTEEKSILGEIYSNLGSYYFAHKKDTKKGLALFIKGIQYENLVCLYSFAYHYRHTKTILSCARYEQFKKAILEQEKPSLPLLYNLYEISMYYEKENREKMENKCYELFNLYGKYHKYAASAFHYFMKGAQEEESRKKENLQKSLNYMNTIFTECSSFLTEEPRIAEIICGSFAFSLNSGDDTLIWFAQTINEYLKKSPLQGYFECNSENQTVEFKENNL